MARSETDEETSAAAAGKENVLNGGKIISRYP